MIWLAVLLFIIDFILSLFVYAAWQIRRIDWAFTEGFAGLIEEAEKRK